MRRAIFAAVIWIVAAASARGDEPLGAAPTIGETATTAESDRPEDGPRMTPEDDGGAHIAPPLDQEIRLQVAVVEVSLTEMQRRKIDFPQFGLPQQGNGSTARSRALTGQQQIKPEAVKTLVDALTRQNALRVVAAQAVVVGPRQPGYLFAAGKTTKAKADRSQALAEKKLGTEVHLTVAEMSDSRVRLHLRAIRTDAEPLASIARRGGTAPAYRTSNLELPIEVDLGMTAVCGGLVQQETVREGRPRRNVQKETETLFLITPELNRHDPDTLASPPARPGNSQTK